MLESFETFAKINSAAVNNDLINLSRQQVSVQAKLSKSAETTREALIFFFSEDGRYIRNLLEDTVVDGFDSLSKEAVANVLTRLGMFDRNLLVPFIGFRKVNDMNLFAMNEEDTKRVKTILKMWDYFGPSP